MEFKITAAKCDHKFSNNRLEGPEPVWMHPGVKQMAFRSLMIKRRSAITIVTKSTVRKNMAAHSRRIVAHRLGLLTKVSVALLGSLISSWRGLNGQGVASGGGDGDGAGCELQFDLSAFVVSIAIDSVALNYTLYI